MLYRIIKKRTGSLQPGGSYWDNTVLYCGYDRREARRVYHNSRVSDGGGGYGNPCIETVCQTIEDGDTDDFEDDDISEEE